MLFALFVSSSFAKETFEFGAEVGRLMTMLVDSVYGDKQVFLRELISNGSDALSKARELILKGEITGDVSKDFRINIIPDKEKKILLIEDTGVGMTKDDMIKFLGTIAYSGTADFMQNAKEGKEGMIGQFGIGFYSAYLVSDLVEVYSKSYKDEPAHKWVCSNREKFEISEDSEGIIKERGTKIFMHLKDDSLEFLEPSRLKELVKTYSQFISFPIYLMEEKSVSEEVPKTEEEIEEEKKKREEEKLKKQEEKKKKEEEKKENEEEKNENEDGSKDEEKVSEDSVEEPEEEIKTTKTVSKTVHELVQANDIKPIWLRSSSEVTTEEYNEFYKKLSGDSEDPLAYLHFNAEGKINFKGLLFIPSSPKDDPLHVKTNKADNIGFYVRHVLITKDLKDFVPDYMKFVYGVIDSDDLPLNISRETIPNNESVKIMKKSFTSKVIELLKTISDDAEKFKKFYEKYANHVKLGIINEKEDKNRDKLAVLLRYPTTHGTELSSFADYISRMKPEQKDIYYITGSDMKELKKSPFVEGLVKKGYEVIYMADLVDEYVTQSLEHASSNKFLGEKKLKNITKGDIKLDDDDEEKNKAQSEEFKVLIDFLKTELASDIDSVKLSTILADAPFLVSSHSFGWSANMLKIMKAQARDKNDPMASFFSSQKKVLEMNPEHPLIKEFLRRVQGEQVDDNLKMSIKLLYQTALVRSGFDISDASMFSSTVEKLLKSSFGVSDEVQEEANQEELKEEVKQEELKEEVKQESSASVEDKEEL